MSLNGVIDNFKQGTFPVTRGTAGSRTLGKWTPGGTSVINVPANVQPLSGKELQALAEGFHANNTWKMYTKTEMLAVDETNQIVADRVTIESEVHEVISVKHFTRSIGGGDHYKVIVARVVP